MLKSIFVKSAIRILRLINKRIDKLVRLKKANLTYLGLKDLMNLQNAVKEVERNKISGLFIETGCALGGSSIAIGWAKSKDRRFEIYDAFGMIPPPSEKDGVDVHKRYEIIKSGKSEGLGTDTYYGYMENLQQVVTRNLEQHELPLHENNIHLIKGYFQDTLSVKEKVAFAHIDCDWYDSVQTCLFQIEPNLSPGGILIFDDYFDWSGCRTAVDDYFADKKSGYIFKTVRKKLHVIKHS